MEDINEYGVFAKKMAENYPRYFGEGKYYGGFAIGVGWYHIIESLVVNIDYYTKHCRAQRARALRKQRAKDKGIEALIQFIVGNKDSQPSDWDIKLAEEAMENDIAITPKLDWIEIHQIKEKFGGLRFYYSGGDERISGMEAMAESWAGRSCETCGDRGDPRSGGWIRTLCDKHEAEMQAKRK